MFSAHTCINPITNPCKINIAGISITGRHTSHQLQAITLVSFRIKNVINSGIESASRILIVYNKPVKINIKVTIVSPYFKHFISATIIRKIINTKYVNNLSLNGTAKFSLPISLQSFM